MGKKEKQREDSLGYLIGPPTTLVDAPFMRLIGKEYVFWANIFPKSGDHQ